MSHDLEEQLKEMDPSASLLVARLRAAPRASTSDGFTSRTLAAVRAGGPVQLASVLNGSRRSFNWWAAAAAAAVVVLGSLFLSRSVRGPDTGAAVCILVNLQRPDGTFSGSSAAPYVQAVAVQALVEDRASTAALRAPLESAVAALVRTQTAEGGWANAAQTSRNVAALAAADAAGVASARIPYRRGLRYLRAHGISEFPASALARAARAALDRLASGDGDFARCCGDLVACN